MRITHYLCLLLLHSLCTTKAEPRPVIAQEKKPSISRIDQLYTGVKIAGVATLSIVTVLAYMRINASLNNIDTLTHTMRSELDLIKHLLKNIRPAIRRIPKVAKNVDLALSSTHITMKQLRKAAAHAKNMSGKLDAILDPQVVSTPGFQAFVQRTMQSLVAGFKAGDPTPPTDPWTPAAVVSALAKNPSLVPTATLALFSAWRSSAPTSTSTSTYRAMPSFSSTYLPRIDTRRFAWIRRIFGWKSEPVLPV